MSCTKKKTNRKAKPSRNGHCVKRLVPEAEIRRHLRSVIAQKQVFEIRLMGCQSGRAKPYVVSGYFDHEHIDRAAALIAGLDDKGDANFLAPAGCYYTANPVNEGCLGRAENKLEAYPEHTTGDASIKRRTALLIDLDPVRETGTSSTDEQVKQALEMAREIRDAMATEGWAAPIFNSTGNGGRLRYEIDLPNDSESAALVKAVLDTFHDRFSNEYVKIDTALGNASRLDRLCGTWNRKGDSTKSQPHRKAYAIEIPDDREPVPLEKLRKFAQARLSQQPNGAANGRPDGDHAHRNRVEDLEGFLRFKDFNYRVKTKGDVMLFELDPCPFSNGDHGHRGESAIFLNANGDLGFKCHHASCTDFHWKQFVAKFGPPLFRITSNKLNNSANAVLGNAALSGLIGEYVHAYEPHTEATPAGILGCLIPKLCGLIGPSPHTIGGEDQPIRLFTCIVGATNSGRKGTADSVAVRLCKAIDTERYKKIAEKGLSTGEGLIQRCAKEDDHVVVITEREFSRVLKVMKREGNTLGDVIREMFDTGDLGVMTKVHVKADGVHGTICAHITPTELKAKLDSTDQANGFCNRFLWLYSKSEKMLPNAAPLDFGTNKMRDLIQRFKTRIDEARSKTLVVMGVEADKLFKSVYPELRSDKAGLAGKMTARGACIVMRLSLLYALLDETAITIIRKHNVEAALAVWDYNVQTVEMLFGSEMGQDSTQSKILALLKEYPELKTNDFHSHMNVSGHVLNGALAYLETIGKVNSSKRKKEKGAGRPSTVWSLVIVPYCEDLSSVTRMPQPGFTCGMRIG
jgi:Protein of unknown function (DUF3987)